MTRKYCSVLPEGTPVPAGDDEVLLAAQQVCSRLGGISLMTLWRWLSSDVVRFPQPTVRINNRRYWSASSIRRWLSDRRSQEITHERI
jgi:predicted DNA-binding transcriptional regulator AlpA